MNSVIEELVAIGGLFYAMSKLTEKPNEAIFIVLSLILLRIGTFIRAFRGES